MTTSAYASNILLRNSLQIDMAAARMSGRDIGSGNITVNGQNNSIHCSPLDIRLNRDGPDNIASWIRLHSIDYFPSHEDALSKRAPGTGKWFFGTDTYQMWVSVDDNMPRNLECIGIPGAGKTSIASAVIEDLQDRFASESGEGIVLYAYFKHDAQSSQTVPLVLISMLRQLIESERSDITPETLKFYKEYSSRPTIVPARDKVMKVLQLELSTFKWAYIIIDALDEYSVHDYFASHALVTQLQLLNKKLLITSRHPVGFPRGTFATLRVSARADDIRLLLQNPEVTGHLAGIFARSPSLPEEIVTVVMERSQGMFVIARLLLDCIPDFLTAEDIRKALKTLPSGPNGIYHLTMTRIQEQRGQLAQLAMRVLAWVYLARARLSVTQLRHAVSFKFGMKILHEDNLIGEDRIISACAGLVSFVKEADVLYCQFAHSSTKAFFDSFWREYFPDAERTMTQTCLEYLVLAVSYIPPDAQQAVAELDPPCTTSTSLDGFPFFPYAALHWGSHASSIDGAFNLEIGSGYYEHPMSPYMVLDHDTESSDPHTTSANPMCHWMHYFAKFGLIQLFKKYYHRDPHATSHLENTHDATGNTAIHLSAQHGHGIIVKFLLENGANPDTFNKWGQSPLSLATFYEHSSVVKVLLDGGCNPNVFIDDHGRTSIFHAVQKGHPDIVKLLVSKGADINLRDDGGWTPLFYAIVLQHSHMHLQVEMVQTLLDHDAVVDQPDHEERAPISYAVDHNSYLPIGSKSASPDIVRLLLRYRGVGIHRKDKNGDTPFSLVQQGNNPKIRQLFDDYISSRGRLTSHPSRIPRRASNSSAQSGHELVVPSYQSSFTRKPAAKKTLVLHKARFR